MLDLYHFEIVIYVIPSQDIKNFISQSKYDGLAETRKFLFEVL